LNGQIPDADFTPNRDRSISIDGKSDEALLDRLRPEILELTRSSRDPITVFIHNGGGNTDEILRLLRATTPDDPRPSPIITVAASYACSAGATLLSAGDFAIASPECRLLYHGGRWPLSDLVSAGDAGLLYARTLPTFHERNAAALARNSARRFLFILNAHRSLFAAHRADAGGPGLSDLECFQALLRARLSPAGQKVLETAIALDASQNGLMLHFRKRLRRGRTVTIPRIQKLMRHASMDFEDQNNKGNTVWDAGLGNIADHFFFLQEYFDFGTLRDWIAAREEPQTADAEADYLLPFRVFLHAICRALQQGENHIPPVDALWLGLIDTVRDVPL
jgi:ATP-dependent protease ClpP protease subunit